MTYTLETLNIHSLITQVSPCKISRQCRNFCMDGVQKGKKNCVFTAFGSTLTDFLMTAFKKVQKIAFLQHSAAH